MKTIWNRWLLTVMLMFISASVLSVGIDLQNTRSFSGGNITKSTVNNLKVKWVYQTVPDTGDNNAALGSISSTPAVDDDYIYFNDLSGYLTKLNRFTGALIWRKNYIDDFSIPGMVVKESRNTPYISGDLLIVGSNFSMLDRLCRMTGEAPSALGCSAGDGAIVLAINKDTGALVWRQKVETHPASKITGSISGHDNVIYVPVASWEEEWSRSYPNIYKEPIDPESAYPCCSSRGSLVALDVNTGNVLWKKYMVIGDDPDHELSFIQRLFLGKEGFFGTSTYGHNPTIDTGRRQVYITTAQTSTAPVLAQLCEVLRRVTGNPNADFPFLPQSLKCNTLNEEFHSYPNAILAVNMDTGNVNWSFYARKYDAWNHACAAPDFYGYSALVPILFPVPVINGTTNCQQIPIGPDMGFGQQPLLLKNITFKPGVTGDIVVAGNKDGRLFGLNPSTGQKIWETNVDPGGLYGGLQFGIAGDDGKIFFGTANSSNINRKISTPFVPVEQFLSVNGFSALGLKVGKFIKKDGATPVSFPAPSNQILPFPGPNIIYGITDYPDIFPDPDNIGGPDVFLKGPASGPVELWTLINPPADVIADGKTVFNIGGKLKTINGMVQAVSAKDGKILWQRPAYDGIVGTLNNGQAFGTLTVGNGLVFIGYADGQGTMVALDQNTGQKLFEFHNTITLLNGSKIRSGSIEAGPQVVGNMVYWGVGAETLADVPNKDFVITNAGNRLYGFELDQ